MNNTFGSKKTISTRHKARLINTQKLRWLLSILLTTAHSYAQDRGQKIDSLLSRTYQRGLFNGNVLVIDQGRTVYQRAWGYADATKHTPLTKQHRFHIGSIAKEFNAVAIMQLAEQGRLGLDSTLICYLPDLPAWAKQIHVRDLLQYSSGLPDLNWKKISSERAAMDSVRQIVNLNFAPGTAYAYNNTNTLLQRQIVARLSGQSFNRFVQSQLLDPLQMSTAVIDPDEQTPLMALGFNDDFITFSLKAPISGWTALTLDDFYKWQKSLQDFKLISPASVHFLLTPFSPGKQSGLGGGSMQGNQLLTHVHDGTFLNYQALIVYQATSERTILLLTNQKQNKLYELDTAIEAILDGKPYQVPKKAVLTALRPQLDTASGAQLVKAYQALRRQPVSEYDIEQESSLNLVGYTLLSKKRYPEAIAILSQNAGLFPKSGNVYDSLAEAYLLSGNKTNALRYYKQAVGLDPLNKNAMQKLKLLEP